MAARLFGAGDLYEKDQPKTIAYTADIVLHGRYALPRDVIYQPATKPPMYNWIGAAAVCVTGRWDEWILKLPSLLATLGTGWIVFVVARRCGGCSGAKDFSESADSHATWHGETGLFLGILACGIWFTFGSDVRHGSVIRLSYLARPDMLQCFFLTAAWACGLRMLAGLKDSQENTPKLILNRHLGWVILFWICITAAILTKGPAAIMVVVFAGLWSIFTTRRWAWLCGIFIPIVLAGGWLGAAYLQDPDHVRQTIIGAEVLDRVTEESPEGFSKPVYYSVMWFVTKALPWGLAALAGMWIVVWKRDRYSAFLPVVVWLVVVLGVLSIPAGKRMDYLLPAYPPGAILAAVMLWHIADCVRGERLKKFARVGLFFLPLILAIAMAVLFQTRFHESQARWTDHATAFVKQVRVMIGNDQAVVVVRGKHPIPTLLGRHQGSYLTPDDFAGAKWAIAPEEPDVHAECLSEPVPIGFETVENRQLARIGLYRVGNGGISPQRLVELQKTVGQWSREENPYRAPGTVFRDTIP